MLSLLNSTDYEITASKWILGRCIDFMEEERRQTIRRRRRMLHLFLHFAWIDVSNAESSLPNLQEKIPFSLPLQVVFNQSKFYLPIVQKSILKIKMTQRGYVNDMFLSH